jgi:hypothetical protein
MEKLDLKKSMPDYFKATAGKFSVVIFPSYNYLMVDGEGDPNTSSDYIQAIELLYGASYTLKFMSKNEFDNDYVVPPLEGLWWANEMKTFETREKSKWSWTMMIMVPIGISRAQAEKAVNAFHVKKPEKDVSKLRFEKLTEGLCVQTLHIGSYDDEGQL